MEVGRTGEDEMESGSKRETRLVGSCDRECDMEKEEQSREKEREERVLKNEKCNGDKWGRERLLG